MPHCLREGGCAIGYATVLDPQAHVISEMTIEQGVA
jgi:hypothetical protein